MAQAFMPLTLSNTGAVIKVRAAAIVATQVTDNGTIIHFGSQRMLVTEPEAVIIASANAILSLNLGLGV